MSCAMAGAKKIDAQDETAFYFFRSATFNYGAVGVCKLEYLILNRQLRGDDIRRLTGLVVIPSGWSLLATTINTMSGSSFRRERLAGSTLRPPAYPRRIWRNPLCHYGS